MMKKYNYYYIVLAVLFLIPVSCNDDFLNTKPLDKISSDAVWGDGPLSQAFVFNVYSALGYGGFEEEALAAYTDEAMFTHAGRGIQVTTEATLSPTNQGNDRVTRQWGEMYLAIRSANIAIANLPEATFDDNVLKDRLLGESYFLRAYYYHELTRLFGGVPIIDKPLGLNDDYLVPRSTWAECVTFMLADLEKAIQLLDGKPETPGRASKLSAMGLKSRILLYTASDLFDGPTAQSKSTAHSGYSNVALVANVGGDRAARWRAAKDAAKAVLDATSGYKMDLSAPVSAEEGTKNAIAMAMGGGSAVADASASAELLFERTHSTAFTREDNWPLGGIHYGINNGPNGYHNWAGNTPIQQLVDDYEMMDGSKFNWSNPAHKASPYTNRDPRFKAHVMHDGSDWKPRPSDVTALDPANQVQTGYYDDGKGGTINGIDTRESPIENWNGSRTHYYTRKFLDPNPALPDNQSNGQVVPFPFIRVTEMALNYIEACIELGEEAEARTWLNKIRFRVGMPAVTDSGDALRQRYRNERRIELSYEEHRYFDARRWMIGRTTLGRGIQTIDIRGKLKPGKTALTPYRYDPTTYDYTYTVVENTENETRKWDDKLYFRPLDRDEMFRNTNLVQNPGY
ncbi:MAG: RagB/SusD family nutrient uptake outer membrane protein [Saprospiraceae bacterium]|nr:RagB/SusD family nutrient uptake outer membrane protein [Saprospiraceae bacterium]